MIDLYTIINTKTHNPTFPTFVRTIDPDDFMLRYVPKEFAQSFRAFALILNTFDSLELDALEALHEMYPHIYTVGPLNLLFHQMDEKKSTSDQNPRKEQQEIIKWLDSKEPNSVVYVNLVGVDAMPTHQVEEFSWGIGNSNKPFVWLLKHDHEKNTFPPEFVFQTKERGIIGTHVSDELVLKHPSIGGFLNRMTWNPVMDSISGGVPMIGSTSFAAQPTHCWYVCEKLGIGMEIDGSAKRDEVERVVRELMEGEKGMEMRKRAMEWKREAEKATKSGGSSYQNLDKLLEVLLGNKEII